MGERGLRKISIFLLAVLGLVACAGTTPLQNSEVVQAHSSAAPTQGNVEHSLDEEATSIPSKEDLLARGRDAANRGEWQSAIAFYDQVLVLDSSNALSLHLRGQAHRALGNLTQALTDYDQAIALDATFSATYNSRGQVYAEVGDHANALADFGRAIELEPGFALAYRNRAEVQITQGKYEAAIFDLQIYLALAPNALDSSQVEAQIAEILGALPQTVDADGLLYSDDFSDPTSGWYSNGDPALFADYDSGGYRLVHPQPDAAGWALPGRLFTDVRVEVHAEKRGGDDDNFFGLMCRVQGTTGTASFYVMMISSDGYYGIGKRVEGGELALIGQPKMQFSAAINLGENSNVLRAECEGDRLALFANEEMLGEVHDSDLNIGQIGLMVGTFDEPGTNILFDNLTIYALPLAE